jgi:hypothetical protein
MLVVGVRTPQAAEDVHVLSMCAQQVEIVVVP